MIFFFDTETTGKLDNKAPFDALHQPNLVQLAGMMTSFGGEILAQLNVIIEPDGWEISDEVAAIHGISHAKAKEAGIPRKVALAAFNHLCRQSHYLVAHNLDFDHMIMRTAFHRIGAQHRMGHLKQVCTMKAATPVLKLPSKWKRGNDYKWPTLTETYAHFFDGATFDGAHNAMNDVVALVNVFNAMLSTGDIKIESRESPMA